MIAHPDYLIEMRAREIYIELLRLLAGLGDSGLTWAAPPVGVNQWFRVRSEMILVSEGSSWRVKGAGSERARLGYARLREGRVEYDVVGTNGLS